jgi:hypothetical protein
MLGVGGRAEVAVGYAERLRATFPDLRPVVEDLFLRSSLLTLDGWGNAALGKRTCVCAAVAGYLMTGQHPADGTTCQPDAWPFATAPGGRQAPRPEVPAGLPLC